MRVRQAGPKLAGAFVLALSVASCGGSSGGSSTESNINAGGRTIPKTTSTEAKQPTTVTTSNGAPKVVQFKVPGNFWCLHADPGQAQVIVGWSAPSATSAAVLLDGKRVHTGIRKTLPFAVPAGDPSGIGSTVVFPCNAGNHHRITIRWRAHGSPAAERTVTITKATRQ
jgi:hypothetical protein